MSRVVLAVALVALLAVSANAWWCTGHMAIATIAKSIMSSDAVSRVENSMSQLSQMGPFPMASDMVGAACWADDLKSTLASMSEWHFINQAYDPTDFLVPPGLIQNEDAVTVISQMYDAVKWKPNTWELSMAVAYIIHLIGDIHQPLHATTLVSAQFPNSDYGGNLFDTSTPNTGPIHLHQVWDSICTQYMEDPVRPLNSTGKSIVDGVAKQFMNAYNLTDKEKNVYNSTDMALESYQVAVDVSYNGIVPGQALSNAYLADCLTAAGRQIALAGYRLGNQLNYLFKDHSIMSDSQLARHIMKHAKRVGKPHHH